MADTVYLNVLRTRGTCSPALLIVFSQVVTLRIICFLKVTIQGVSKKTESMFCVNYF